MSHPFTRAATMTAIVILSAVSLAACGGDENGTDPVAAISTSTASAIVSDTATASPDAAAPAITVTVTAPATIPPAPPTSPPTTAASSPPSQATSHAVAPSAARSTPAPINTTAPPYKPTTIEQMEHNSNMIIDVEKLVWTGLDEDPKSGKYDKWYYPKDAIVAHSVFSTHCTQINWVDENNIGAKALGVGPSITVTSVAQKYAMQFGDYRHGDLSGYVEVHGFRPVAGKPYDQAGASCYEDPATLK